jgi:hypothetical protein
MTKSSASSRGGKKLGLGARKAIYWTSSLGVVALAAVVAMQFGLSPNKASAHYSDCGENSLCFWDDSSYGGRFLGVPDADRLLWTPNIGDFMNDKTTSIWNRTGKTINFYNDVNGGSSLVCQLGPGDSDADLGSDQGGGDDEGKKSWEDHDCSDAQDNISSFYPV